MKSALHRRTAALATASTLSAALVGCAAIANPPPPSPALQGGCASCLLAGSAIKPADFIEVGPHAPADREAQTRRFDGISEAELITASLAVLQDLGFAIKLSDPQLGLIAGEKEQEAKAPEQKAAFTLLTLLAIAAAAHSGGSMPPIQKPSEEQTVRVMLVIVPAPSASPRSHLVRVTFHRFVRHPLQRVADSLREPELYEAFFELLSKAVFLEAHKL